MISTTTPNETLPVRPRVTIGRAENGEPMGFSARDLNGHFMVVGGTGRGKSKTVEVLLRQLIDLGESGMLVIDPHNSLTTDLLRYMTTECPHVYRRVIVVDPTWDRPEIAGLNPFPPDLSDEDAAYVAGAMAEAVIKAGGAEKAEESPRINRTAFNTFWTLIKNQLTLNEALPLIATGNAPKDELKKLRKQVTNELIEDDLRFLESANVREKKSELEGVANRLRLLLAAPPLRRMVASRTHRLDLANCMEQGKIVLLSLSGNGKIPPDAMRMFGTFVLNEVIRTAMNRDEHQPGLKTFHVVCDEFGTLATRSMAKALSETRKRKVFFGMLFQHLAQVKSDDEYIYSAIMTNTDQKIVMGGVSAEDAQALAEAVFTGYLPLKEIKDELRTTKTRAHEETRESRTTASGKSSGSGKSNGDSKGGSESRSEGSGETESRSEQRSTGQGTAQGTSSGVTESQGSSVAEGVSASQQSSSGTSRTVSTGSSQGSQESRSVGSSHGGSRTVSNTTSSSRTRSRSTSDSESSSESRGDSSFSASGKSEGAGDSLTSLVSIQRDARGALYVQRNTSSARQSSFGRHQSSGFGQQRSQSTGRTRSVQQGSSETIGSAEAVAQGENWGHQQSRTVGTNKSRQQSEAHGVQESVGQSQGASRTETASESTAAQQGESQQRSESSSEAQGSSTGASTSKQAGTSQSNSESESASEQASTQSSESVTVSPFQRLEEYQEVTGRTFWSLAEMTYFGAAHLMRLPRGSAMLCLDGRRPVEVQVTRLRDVGPLERVERRMLERFVARVIRAHPEVYLLPEDLQAETLKRQMAFFGREFRYEDRAPFRNAHGQLLVADRGNPFA